MAQKVAVATGAYSAAATWNSVTNTPTLHASANVTISTTNRFTATFTAPNTTNACTGVLVFVATLGTTGSVVCTLQESTVDTAATVTIAVSALVANSWVFFKFPTPYVFTTVVAGSYRFKFVNASVDTTQFASDSGGGNLPAYLATDNRTGVPGSTDDLWLPSANQAAPVTVTMDGTQTVGSGTDTVVPIQRTLGNAIIIGNGSILAWDTVADATLTCKGNIVCNVGGGELRMGTVASPMPAARTAKLIMDMAATVQAGIKVFDGGKLTLQGTPKSSTSLWKAKYVSGTGVAASPLVVDTAVDWSVGDEIAVGPTGAYDQTEYRFIITKNSATSYVLSATSGGAEAAFAHTHTTDAWVLNVGRNVQINANNIARPYYINIVSTVSGDCNIDWTTFDGIGDNATDKTGFLLNGTGIQVNIDYSVFSRYYNPLDLRQTKATLTFAGLICIRQQGTGDGLNIQGNANNKTFTDLYILDAKRVGLRLVSYNLVFTRAFFIGCNKDANANAAGISFAGAGLVTFNSCEVHLCRVAGLRLGGATDVVFNSFLCGTKGQNTTIDLSAISDTYNTLTFISSTFGSATFVSNYLSMIPGSELRFHRLSNTDNNHIWYTPFGTARSTGAGLVDTNVRTAGTLNVRIAPENSTDGFTWDFLILARAMSAVSVTGFIQKNAALGSDVVTVSLFLPGSTTADATQTMPNDTAYNVFSLAANYTGSVPGLATVRINAKTTTPSAYIYVADIFNGTNDLTNLKTWYNGKPAQILFEQLGDSAAVWGVLKSTQTTIGTMGYEIVTDLDDIQTRLQTIDDFLDTEIAAILAAVDTEVAAIKAKTDSLTFTVAGQVDANTLLIEGGDATNQIRDAVLTDATRFAGASIDAAISSRATPAQVNTEVVDVLTVDTFAESAGVPAATASIKDKIAWLATLARNKITQTATTQVLRNDGDSGNVGSAPVSDDGTTATRSKWS